MAKDLTDVNTYTTAITVPEGDDPRSHAAEDVESVAQGLANRTEWLRAFVVRAILADDAARSILTVPLTVNTGTVRDPMLRTTQTPDDAGSTVWLEFLRANNDSSQRSSLYFGEGSAGNGFAGLVVNAQWREDHGNKWRQLDATKPSYFVYISDAGELRFSKKEAATADWAEWDTTTDCTIGAPSVEATNVQTAALQVNTVNLSLCPITTSETLGYVSPKTRTTPVRTMNMIGRLLVDGATGYVRQDEDDPNHKASCALNLPVGSTLDSLRVRHIQATATGDRFSVMKRTNLGSGTLTFTEVAFATANATFGVSEKITTISPVAYTVAAGDELFLQWRINDSGTPDALTNNEVRGGDMTWSELVISYQ